MPGETLGTSSQETERPYEEVEQDLATAIEIGNAEKASICQAELLKINNPGTDENPAPATVDISSINSGGYSVDHPLAAFTPKNIGFLRPAALTRASNEAGYRVTSESTVAPVRARLAAQLTGRYRIRELTLASGETFAEFTAVGAGDTFYGEGSADELRTYLDGLGFKELAPAYERNTQDEQLALIMPDVQLTLHNLPKAA